ncbi:alpha-2-macroglobulin receptor-associated protein [Oratosquilla oratoria]|uniref:alpha-2-macroglobulin receptor-associated protein n=1 Tax=Oratosquilla oratoria TaxID=337810 RepID=UPI003F76A71F
MKSVYIFMCIIAVCLANKASFKYTKEANIETKTDDEVKMLRSPLRMAKLNLIWDKAAKWLSAPKLRTLLTDLKAQDKAELTLKKVKADGGDKEGLKEAELRKKLRGILNRYGLNEQGTGDGNMWNAGPPKERYLNEVSDQKILKAVFKDKKLNKLWTKAEQSGFSEEELKALKEEFTHHQDKVDEYYSILESMNNRNEYSKNHISNEILSFDNFQELEGSSKSVKSSSNTVREKHRELKEGYDRLHKVASTGPDSKEFLEPKVALLWKMATRADFTQAELESLHTELKHYEHRLLKVRHLTGQMAVAHERDGRIIDTHDEKLENMVSSEGQRIMLERIEKQKRKVEKLHEDLEMRIMQRHLEL